MKTLVAISLIFFSFSALAEDNRETFGKQMMTFYQSPSPEAFQQFQRDADRYEETLSIDDTKSDVFLPVAVSIATIAGKHGWPIEAKGISGRRAKDILTAKADFDKYIEDEKQVDASKLDIWWVSFFSTGDTSYLEKIFKFAREPEPNDDLHNRLVIAAATWSFKSNCDQDKVVRDFVIQQLSSSTNSIKKEFWQECTAINNE